MEKDDKLKEILEYTEEAVNKLEEAIGLTKGFYFRVDGTSGNLPVFHFQGSFL